MDMDNDTDNWYAIRTHKDFEARRVLEEYCADVFLPTEDVKVPSTGRTAHSKNPVFVG